MPYQFLTDRYYRMPTHFGPSLGPRQGLNGRRYANTTAPTVVSARASFTTDAEELETFLPPGFELRQASVSFCFDYISDVEWLAGRGYNTFGVTIPATYRGQQETVHGDLLLVLWENMADPIITGREDLGFAKVYCELPKCQLIGDQAICRASWDGFEFANLKLSNLAEIAVEDLPEVPVSDGTLHYKYIPKTGCPGEADAEYALLTPNDWPNTKLDQVKMAKTATIEFHRSAWEELPTLVHIVNALADISLGDCIGASLVKVRGGKDLSDQRILT